MSKNKGKKDEKNEEEHVEKEVKEEGGEQEEVVELSPLNNALKVVLRKSLVRDGLARGIRESLRAIERGEAKLCVLANDCTEKKTIKRLLLHYVKKEKCYYAP